MSREIPINDLLVYTTDEIHMPRVLYTIVPSSSKDIGAEDFETAINSYDYWRDKALFDSVVNDDVHILRGFALGMSGVIPYSDSVSVSLNLWDDQDWDGILVGVLEKIKRNKELVLGRELDNFEDVVRCKLQGRDYLLETRVRAVENHIREQRSMRRLEELGYTVRN